VASLSRRQFIRYGASAGAAAAFGPALFAACGGSSTAVNLDTLSLVQRFPKDVLTPGRVRLPLSLATKDGILGSESLSGLPNELKFAITDLDGNAIFSAPFTVTAHATDVPQPYWPVVAEIDNIGTYFVTLDGSEAAGAAFQIVSPNDVAMPTVGNKLPAFDTPTVAVPRGVSPVCTRTPTPCPLHDINLRDALTMRKPVVYLIGTPAYCQTGTCTPALDALLEVHKELGDRAVFIHAEVYTDTSATTYAPAVSNYKMTFEPALFITDETGILVERLDAIFDVGEVRDALTRNGIS
jgi:hypothetical protein